MNFLEERILKDGIVKEGNVLKVDSFLNHQMDVELLDQIGEEFYRRFADLKITKVLTIEASGIAIAYAVARCFKVPMVFAKKAKSINIDGDMYTAEVESFTHKNKNKVIVSKRFLSSDDHLLIVDDFLANGCALQGLISIAEGAGASIEGESQNKTYCITKQDLMELGLSGGANSSAKRKALLKKLDLPEHMSSNAMLQALSLLYAKEELIALMTQTEKCND